MAAMAENSAAIEFDHVSLAFDDVVVLYDVSFRVADADMTILFGPSGSGKSLLLKMTLGLLRPDAGTIRVHDQQIETLSENELMAVRNRIGMLFQETALFDSLTVGQNVGFKLDDQRLMDADGIRARVEEVLTFVGLAPYVDRLPGHLSGGQRRRVAIARAMAAKPSLLLLDDPTSGLDPITGKSILNEIVKVRDLQKVGGIVVTHQLQDAFYIATHQASMVNGDVVISRRSVELAGATPFLVLADGGIQFDGPAHALLQSDHPWIARSLSGWIPELSLDPPDVALAGQS